MAIRDNYGTEIHTGDTVEFVSVPATGEVKSGVGEAIIGHRATVKQIYCGDLEVVFEDPGMEQAVKYLGKKSSGMWFAPSRVKVVQS